jgi:hypothetical protein
LRTPTFAFPRQLLEPVPGWDAKVLEGFSGVEHRELPQGNALEIGWQAF